MCVCVCVCACVHACRPAGSPAITGEVKAKIFMASFFFKKEYAEDILGLPNELSDRVSNAAPRLVDQATLTAAVQFMAPVF